MKRILMLALFSTVVFQIALAQEKVEKDDEKDLFNQWSLEANVGQNKAIRPYTSGYFSSDPTSYFNFSDVNHFDLGVRYMFSTTFGLKLDFGYDGIKNQSGSGSLAFDSKQYRVGLQGVTNLARIMKFETFSGRLGLLAHAGVQVSQFKPQLGLNKGHTEDNGGIMLGLTPQIRISNTMVVTGDFTAINNVRQHFNWDGTYSAADNNLSGIMYNVTLGLTIYLGGNEKHADWYVAAANQNDKSEDTEARKRLDSIETLMNDTDKDGIQDYLDSENNTPNGVVVDSKGRFIDNNRNGVPDELERKSTGGSGLNGIDGNFSEIGREDAIKSLITKGYVNIFFDTGRDYPNNGSTNNVYYIIQFLRQYPDTKAKLMGYADETGNQENNLELSKRRAENLYKIIINSGIDKSRLQIVGQGVDSTYSSELKGGLDLARRVSIIIE